MGLGADYAGPGGEWQVAGQGERGVLVAGADELEEQVRGVLFEGQVADLVDHDQPVAAQLGQLGCQASGAVGLAVAGCAGQHDVAGLAQERLRGQRPDLVADGAA